MWTFRSALKLDEEVIGKPGQRPSRFGAPLEAVERRKQSRVARGPCLCERGRNQRADRRNAPLHEMRRENTPYLTDRIAVLGRLVASPPPAHAARP
jgi:hypothetical protein